MKEVSESSCHLVANKPAHQNWHDTKPLYRLQTGTACICDWLRSLLTKRYGLDDRRGLDIRSALVVGIRIGVLCAFRLLDVISRLEMDAVVSTRPVYAVGYMTRTGFLGRPVLPCPMQP